MKSISLPNSIKSIGYKSFYGCTSLEKNEFDNALYLGNEMNPYLVLIDGKNTNIKSCITNSQTKIIGNEAFAGCDDLVDVAFSPSIEIIENSAFLGKKLKSIIIPKKVKNIGIQAFGGCANISNIVVDSANTVYDSRKNCNAIIESATKTLVIGCKNTVIPEGITSIEKYAFYGCRDLKSIIIPRSIKFIGQFAFDECGSLSRVFYGGNSSELEDIFLNNHNNHLMNATIYYYSEIKPNDNGNYWHYVNGEPVKW